MSPRLIEPGRLTVAALLQRRGYHTAAIGKWHLGMDWALKPGEKPFGDSIEKGEDGWRADFSKPIRNGPNSVGFDYFFGITASLDMVPYTFIENDRVTTIPTSDKAFEMMLGRTNRLTRRGPAAQRFKAEDVLPALTKQAVRYIGQRAPASKRGKPFFLYLPLASPHTPIVPSAQWRRRSGLNPYADFVMETDWAVGEVMRAIERAGISSNTVVFFTSDNGCSPEADFPQLRRRGHEPSHPLRGAKADIFEGGHRVPLVVAWPGRVPAGTRSDQLACLNDLMATCAEMIDAQLPDDAAEDSVSLLPILLGTARGAVRTSLVHHSIHGSFAIRDGNWKLALCADSGGWSAPRPGSPASRRLPPVQLYDLSRDIGETNNLASVHPDVVERLTRQLEDIVRDGRSTPGAPQPNTVPVRIRKPARN